MERMTALQESFSRSFRRGQELLSGCFSRKADGEDARSGQFFYTFEDWLVCGQEILIWSNPGRSLFWFFFTQVALYQFTLASFPIISSTAYCMLIMHVYKTWRHLIWPAIRVKPEMPEDTEGWTTINPETFSAPEMERIAKQVIHRIDEIYSGLKLMRRQNHLLFFVVMSLFWLSLAFFGSIFSTPFLLHSLAVLTFIIPPVLIRLSKKPEVHTVLVFLGEVIAGCSQVLVYNHNVGNSIYSELDGFIPEDKTELESLQLNDVYGGSAGQKDEGLETELDPDTEIPSHETDEFDGKKTLSDFEMALLQDSLNSEMQISDDDDLYEDEQYRALEKKLPGIDIDSDQESF